MLISIFLLLLYQPQGEVDTLALYLVVYNPKALPLRQSVANYSLRTCKYFTYLMFKLSIQVTRALTS